MTNVVEKFRPLFYPRGIVVTGVSQHPGKFGAVAFHNLIACGYQGELFPINREGVDQWKNFEPWLGELRAALGK